MTTRPTTSRASLSTAMSNHADAATSSVMVCRAGRVVAYHQGDKPTADVQMVHDAITTLPDGSVVQAPAPIVYGKPVVMPAGGGVSLSFGLDVGDPVWVVFRDVSHDEYDAGRTDGEYAPQDSRRWDPADALVWPGTNPPSRVDGAPVLTMAAAMAFRVGADDADKKVAMEEPTREELDALWAAVYGLTGHTHTLVALTSPSGPVIPVVGTGNGSTNTSTGTASTRVLGSLRLLTDDTIVPGTGVTG